MDPLEGLTLSHVALVEAVKESPEIGEERLIDCAVGVAPPAAAVNVSFVGEAARSHTLRSAGCRRCARL
jgi:hypothetical protein